MINKIKNWIKKYNDKDMPDGEKQKINPLAWGILFFGFWLTLKSSGAQDTSKSFVSWLMLFCSAAMGLFIIPKVRTMIENNEFLPGIIVLVEQVSVWAFFFGWLFSLPSLTQLDSTISAIFLLFWTVVIFGTIVARAHNRIIRGIAVLIAFVILLCQSIFTYHSDFAGLWPLIPIVIGLLVAVYYPSVFRKMSLA
jgi:hypothetical protein